MIAAIETVEAMPANMRTRRARGLVESSVTSSGGTFSGAAWTSVGDLNSSNSFEPVLYPGNANGFQADFDTNTYESNLAGNLRIRIVESGHYLIQVTLKYQQNTAPGGSNIQLTFSSPSYNRVVSCPGPSSASLLFNAHISHLTKELAASSTVTITLGVSAEISGLAGSLKSGSFISIHKIG